MCVCVGGGGRVGWGGMVGRGYVEETVKEKFARSNQAKNYTPKCYKNMYRKTKNDTFLPDLQIIIPHSLSVPPAPLNMSSKFDAFSLKSFLKGSKKSSVLVIFTCYVSLSIRQLVNGAISRITLYQLS